MGATIDSGRFAEDQEFTIAPARPSNAPQLIVGAKNLGITEPNWRALIATGSVVIATESQTLAGVYLVDHYSLTYTGELLHDLRAARSVLCNRFKLSEENVAFGAEAVIAPEWQVGDLRSHLLRALLRTIGLRYRHVFRFCRKDDPAELETLKGEGWRCFQEEDETCYLMLDVAKALRGLASRLMLRFPPRPAAAISARVGRWV
jgi:hypothetical protein